MHKLTKALAASALIGGVVFAAPVAANAATGNPSYPPASVTNAGTLVTITVAPGGRFRIVFPAHTFAAGVPLSVTFTSTGPVPADGAVAVFRAATASVSGVTSADGSATITGTVPTDANAPIMVTAATTTTDPIVQAAATINIASTAPAASTTATGTSSGLATTGTYISLATVWGAAGLVALGGGAIGVSQLRRKRKA